MTGDVRTAQKPHRRAEVDADVETPTGSGRRRDAVAVLAPPALVLAIGLGAWSAVAHFVYGDRPFILPSPWAVVQAGWNDRSAILNAMWITFTASFYGFIAATVVGIVSAAVMSQSRMLQRGLYPYALLFQTVPIVAVAPIIVLWFGFSRLSVIVISFMIGLFPIITNTLLGLLSASRSQVELFRNHSAGRLSEFWKLRLPNAVPSIIAALRISAGLCVIGAIVGEFIIGAGGSRGGIGVKVIFAHAQLRTGVLFATVAAGALLGFAFFAAVSAIGHLLLRHWHESADAGR